MSPLNQSVSRQSNNKPIEVGPNEWEELGVIFHSRLVELGYDMRGLQNLFK